MPNIALRWHQLLGIILLLRRAFQPEAGLPLDSVVLADDLGLGKTFTILGFMTRLALMMSAGSDLVIPILLRGKQSTKR